ncbi:phage tail spike protein [Streptococcus suis]|nr:phage tail spike protein [Streptococcus suis]
MIYLKDGNIPLNLAYDDDIVQEANSTYQLSFKFPLTDGKWNLLKREVFLLSDDLHGEQEFFIFEAKKANGYVQVYAKQVATLLNYYSINSISVDRVPGQTAMTALAGSIKRNCPFTFFSDIMDRHTFNESNVSVMDALVKDKHSIVGQWGGDLVRDKYQVKLLKNGGIENESLFMYKKNLSSYEEAENINNLKTRLHLKKTIQGQSEGEADRVIAVTVDSPLIGQYRQIYEADIEVNDQDVTDEDSLLAYGQRYFGSTLCDLVENSINLDVKGKSDVSVKMFDTVSVFHERFDVDLRLKITSYHFAPMSKRLKSIGFGKVSQSVKSTMASMVAGSVDKATGRLSASFEQKLQKEIDNANRHFDTEFEKRVESINDGIEQAKAEAERYADNIKQSINIEIAQVNQSMQAQSEEHDRQVADILSKTQSVESLANQAKSDAASALARANQVKTEAIADARAQVATVSQALNTAKSELQTAIASADQKARESQASATALRNDLNLQASKILAQAQAQTALTSRVTTVENLADGTKTTVAELSKTVSKATGDIASVTSRTKTVEDTLTQTRTQYEALTQTVNAQTGQIESINRKTADLQSGIDGVTERFESLQVGGRNLIPGSKTFTGAHWEKEGTWQLEESLYKGAGVLTWVSGKKVSPLSKIAVQAGDTYTFSAYVKRASQGTVYFYLYDSNNTQYATADSPRETLIRNVGDSFQRFVITFKATRSGILRPRFAIPDADTGGFSVAGYQLENGSLASNYIEAPEDIHSEIATYKRTVEESSAELSRRIQLADGKAIEAKTYAQQTAEGFKTRLESLETYKNEEGTRASQYLTASRTETAKQITAERTSISANYVAKSTYTEDARGTTQRLNEIKSTADTAKQNLATYQETVDRKLEELTSSTQTLDGKINTASSKVDTVAGQIRTEISETKALIPTENGGNNLIIGSMTRLPTPYQQANLIFTKNQSVQEWQATDAVRVQGTKGSSNTFCYLSVGRSNYKSTSGVKYVHSIYIKNTGAPFQVSNNLRKTIDIATGETKRVVIFDVSAGTRYLQINFQQSGTGQLDFYYWHPQIETGTIVNDWSPAPEDLIDEISAVKTTITQTSKGVEQLTTSLATTDNKVSTAETKIHNLVNEVSSKVSQTDYNTLTGRVDSAETAITQNATEISKRLTSTQVESAITDKGYQTKSDVDSNITGRGYITDSALQPYALSTTVQTLVEETADSFSRTISETKALIPKEAGAINLILDYENKMISTYNSPQNVIKQDDVAVLEWDTTKAHRISLTTTATGTFGYISSGRTAEMGQRYYLPNTAYTGSIYIKNLTATAFKVSINTSKTVSIGPNQTTRVILTDVPSGQRFLQFNFLSNAANEKIDFIYWHPQIEQGSLATAVGPAPEDLATVTALHAVNDTVDSHTRTIGAVGTAGSILDNVSKVTQTAAGLVQEVSGANGLKTQVSQLAGSWAVKNLTNSGTVLNQLNLNKDGSVKIDGKLVQITGTTYIQDGVITSAKIAGLDAGKITTGTLGAARIKANSIDGSKIAFDEAFFNGLTANEAYLEKLFAKDAFATSVQAVSLSASKISGGVLEATNKAVKFDLNNANITFNQNATINFNSANNALVRRKGTHTAFVHFNDVNSSSDGGVGSLYASIGVTSSGDGINSESSGRFAGLRAFRGARGLTHNATLDQLELYGDRVLLMDDFDLNRGFMFRPAALSRDDFIDMNQLVTCVRALRDMWAHYKNSNGTLSDLLNNRSNSSVNASWENMHSFK